MGSNDKDTKKKKVTKVKTFTVPYTIEKSKDYIYTSNNKINNFSKDKLINNAFKLHKEGKIFEASKEYKLFINKGFEDYRVFLNYGLILKDIGKLKEAEVLQRKAIELNPDFAIAHYNLGNTLRDLSKLEEADLSYRKALKLNYNIAEIHSNHAEILENLGCLKEAFDSHLKAIEIKPKLSNFYTTITKFLRNSDPSKLNKSKLRKILHVLLERNDITHNDLFKAFNFLYSHQKTIEIEQSDSDFSNINLFENDILILVALKKIIFKDAKFEQILTKLRRDICYRIANDKGNITKWQLRLIISLAEQCFSNEYIYSTTKEEKIYFDKIITFCKKRKLNEINLSILACYIPLYKLIDQLPEFKNFLSKNNNFNDLLRLQVFEPLEEIKISKEIKKIGSITNHISKKVRSQYEENPYPRWRYADTFKQFKYSSTRLINAEIKPNLIIHNIKSDSLKILIAGCGTGLQILHAQRYKNAQITAIDISCSSLSFAQRKINELGINNVNLIQMDILDVSLLKDKFDIIECCGVLHHMDNPQQGLIALLEVTKPNSFMKLSLYSALSRQIVIQAREYIKSKQIYPNLESMRNLRKDILSGNCPKLYSLTCSDSDFYNMSNFRDLCFHYQEHRFTFKQLEDILVSNKLKFLGFSLPQNIKSLYKNYFPKDTKQANLKNWGRLEIKHPGIFGGTPHFWVCKNG